MSRKNLNFKSTIFKILIFYIIIYLLSYFLRYSNGFENFIIYIEYRYLALINIISIFLGLPLSIVFDFIFENITFKPIFILIIRTFPILPFSVGSYFIASSEINKRFIVVNSLFGAYFYYLFLFLIIKSA